jgi:Tfp pilus assembly protein PilZ
VSHAVDREHPRYAHEANLTLRVGSRAIEGHSQNLSRGGLCAQMTDAVAIGVDCEVDIVLVFDDDALSEPLTLPARVVWCTPLDDGQQVGLVFRSMDAERTEYLGLFLRYLDDGSRRQKTPRESEIDKRFD